LEWKTADWPHDQAVTIVIQPPVSTQREDRVTEYRINAIFPASEMLTLEKLARDQGKSKKEVIRDAIAMERWYWEARKEGAKIFVEMNDGRIKELVPR
jgi:hypothetical protein